MNQMETNYLALASSSIKVVTKLIYNSYYIIDSINHINLMFIGIR